MYIFLSLVTQILWRGDPTVDVHKISPVTFKSLLLLNYMYNIVSDSVDTLIPCLIPYSYIYSYIKLFDIAKSTLYSLDLFM